MPYVRRGSAYARPFPARQLQGRAKPRLFIVRPNFVRPGLGDFSSVASAIQTIEGWFPGSVSYRNNNPGNLKYAGQPGAIGADSQGFAIFPSIAAGQQALDNQISLDASRGETISEFAAKYAPAQDSNNPVSYAAQIAAATGLSVNDPLSLADSTNLGSSPGLDLSSLLNTGSPGDSGDQTGLYLGLGLAGATALLFLAS